MFFITTFTQLNCNRNPLQQKIRIEINAYYFYYDNNLISKRKRGQRGNMYLFYQFIQSWDALSTGPGIQRSSIYACIHLLCHQLTIITLMTNERLMRYQPTALQTHINVYKNTYMISITTTISLLLQSTTIMMNLAVQEEQVRRQLNGSPLVHYRQPLHRQLPQSLRYLQRNQEHQTETVRHPRQHQDRGRCCLIHCW
eukprot:TRINITY_DN1210_c0_g1_i4.p1 TRINITY_DN1210_c0_g1~~TRINITY_DN1210_c0_g1_i4.p1  ORF type:complete len:198 (-),score=-21.21 TRINITY_DN1210_c0_g1_i4:8-601(-)